MALPDYMTIAANSLAKLSYTVPSDVDEASNAAQGLASMVGTLLRQVVNLQSGVQGQPDSRKVQSDLRLVQDHLHKAADLLVVVHLRLSGELKPL